MKKLNKLQINSEKLMKNEELLTLRGGYGCDYPCLDYCCYCYLVYPYVEAMIDPNLASPQNCNNLCSQMVPYTFGMWQCTI
jgi:hypothetical protein